MDFKLSTIEDIDAIFKFYDWAVAQKKNSINIGKVLKEV